MVDSWRVMTAISRSFTRSVIPGILISVFSFTLDLRCHRYGHVAHLAEATNDQRHAVPVELTLDEAPGPVSDLVVKCQCHNSPLLRYSK